MSAHPNPNVARVQRLIAESGRRLAIYADRLDDLAGADDVADARAQAEMYGYLDGPPLVRAANLVHFALDSVDEAIALLEEGEE